MLHKIANVYILDIFMKSLQKLIKLFLCHETAEKKRIVIKIKIFIFVVISSKNMWGEVHFLFL